MLMLFVSGGGGKSKSLKKLRMRRNTIFPLPPEIFYFTSIAHVGSWCCNSSHSNRWWCGMVFALQANPRAGETALVAGTIACKLVARLRINGISRLVGCKFNRRHALEDGSGVVLEHVDRLVPEVLVLPVVREVRRGV